MFDWVQLKNFVHHLGFEVYIYFDELSGTVGFYIILNEYSWSILTFRRITWNILEENKLVEFLNFHRNIVLLLNRSRQQKHHRKDILNLRKVDMGPHKKTLLRFSGSLLEKTSGGGSGGLEKKRSFKFGLISKKKDTGFKEELVSAEWWKKGNKGILARPNYFVAIPVYAIDVKEKMKEVQKSLIKFNKHLEKTLIPLEKTHLTLAVMHLKSKEEIQCASTALTTAISKMKHSGVSEMMLNFKGVGHFRNQVLFAKLMEDEGFERLCQAAEIVRNTFAEAGLGSTDARAFQAHLTIAKLLKMKGKCKFGQKKVKSIDSQCFSNFENSVFGQEQCSKLQLLSMLKTDKETGYYHCEYEELFSQVEVSSKLW